MAGIDSIDMWGGGNRYSTMRSVIQTTLGIAPTTACVGVIDDSSGSVETTNFSSLVSFVVVDVTKEVNSQLSTHKIC